MIFIGEQAVLIEIKQKNNLEKYLIGDQYFENLNSEILSKIFCSANWNRALKYLTIEDSQYKHLGYFMIRFQLYLNKQKQKIVCLTKKGFEQNIINQKKFQVEFIKDIFNFRNRNRNNYPLRKIDDYSTNIEFIDELIINFNRCFVSNNVSFYKKDKFRIIFKYDSEFGFEHSRTNQLVYYFPFNMGNIDILDIKNKIAYSFGTFCLNNECVSVSLITKWFVDDLIQSFFNQAIWYIKNSLLTKELLNWHMFNITNDNNFLKNEIVNLTSKVLLNDFIKNIDKISKILKINYWPLILSDPVLMKIVVNCYQNPDDQGKIESLFIRYSINFK